MQTKSLIAALGVALLMPGTASALIFQGWSGDGGDVLVDSVAPGSITTISPHAAWGDVSDDAGLPAGTAEWISYGDTGLGGFVAPNISGLRIPGNETAHFQRTFSFLDAGDFSLWILADDTAEVTLTGPGGTQTLINAFAGQLDPCAPGGSGNGLGCVEEDIGIFNTSLGAGSYTLDVYAFQTNGATFGVQYAYAIETDGANVVPAPASIALLGAGLLGLGGILKRRRAR